MAASFETPGTRYHRPLALCLRSFPASRALQKQLHLCTSSLTALTQTKQDSPPRLSQEPSAPKAPPAPRTAASQHGGDSLTTRGSLLRGKRYPKKQERWTARKRTTTKSPGHLLRKPLPLPEVLQAKTVKLDEGGNPCREESMKPKSITGGPHENARRPRARTCRSATSQRQHAHAEASGLHSSCRNPTARAKGKH